MVKEGISRVWGWWEAVMKNGKGPEGMEDQRQEEMLYCNMSRTNWSWRHDYQHHIPLFFIWQVPDLSIFMVSRMIAKFLRWCKFKPWNAMSSDKYFSLGLPEEHVCQRQQGGQTDKQGRHGSSWGRGPEHTVQPWNCSVPQVDYCWQGNVCTEISKLKRYSTD